MRKYCGNCLRLVLRITYEQVNETASHVTGRIRGLLLVFTEESLLAICAGDNEPLLRVESSGCKQQANMLWNAHALAKLHLLMCCGGGSVSSSALFEVFECDLHLYRTLT